ncbi:MAG: D-2-hydroxyacid dehydrogenase family protein [Nocardioides sp.]|nr:D-2-hydroxyacid dehydrogenase family protein [Nocardioides sp.]
MRLRCAVIDDYQAVARECADWTSLTGVECTFIHERFDDEDELIAGLVDFEIVVVTRERTTFSSSVFARLPNLRLLVTSGLRNAAVDAVSAREHGIPVVGTHSRTEPPAELTWALIFALSRHLPAETRNLRNGGPWQSTLGTDLNGATLGLIGLGRIGAQVARVGQAFGMDVMAWSQNLTDERCGEVGVRRAVQKADLLARSDVVSLHLVLSDRSRHTIGRADLAAMKPTAHLINTSRSGLIDTAELHSALRSNAIAGAGLDVFDTEPLPFDDPIRTLPNVVATPHLGYVTRNNYATYFVEDL